MKNKDRPTRRKKKIESETELVKKNVSWLFQAKFTLFLLIVNVIVYLISTRWSAELFQSLVFSKEALLSFNFLPMIASWFLHLNIIHLVGNMIFLLKFGRVVEARYGMFKFGLIYFGSAILSDIISGYFFSQGGIGASGAIAGLIAAALLIKPLNLTYFFFIPIPMLFIGWFAILMDILGIVSPVQGDNIGHISHLAGYLGVTLFLSVTAKKKDIKKGFMINIITVLIGALLFYLFPERIIELSTLLYK